MIDEDIELITFFYGDQVTEEQANEVTELINEKILVIMRLKFTMGATHYQATGWP